jgi:mevalonate kinase
MIRTLTYKYSAPGKVILSGEHSVVYGMPCIAFTVNVRTNVEINLKAARAISNKLIVNLIDFNTSFDYSWDQTLLTKRNSIDVIKNMQEGRPFDTMIEVVKKIAYDSMPLPKEENLAKIAQILRDNYETTITIESQIPFNSGMGSSASISVALSAVLLQFFNTLCLKTLGKSSELFGSKDEFANCVNTYSLFGEKLIHGSPSGVDNCAIIRGGIINYTKLSDGGSYEKISEKPNFLFCIINSNTKRFTSDIIKKVRSIKECFPKLFNSLISSIKQCTISMLEIVKKPILSQIDEDKLMSLVKINHKMLSSLLITHPNLEKVINICEKHGIPAKLTGAGLGGSVVGLVKRSDFEKDCGMLDVLKDDLQKNGYSLITTMSDNIGMHEEISLVE